MLMASSATRSRPASALDVAARLRLAVTRPARRLRPEAAPGPSPTPRAALAPLGRDGPLPPSELAAAERVQRPTATRVVARLEEDGLVSREPDPRDGRSCLVAATDAGSAL